ncbi:MAG: hypothetical protein ABIJ40_20805 [Bacteroidota bacterium]
MQKRKQYIHIYCRGLRNVVGATPICPQNTVQAEAKFIHIINAHETADLEKAIAR